MLFFYIILSFMVLCTMINNIIYIIRQKKLAERLNYREITKDIVIEVVVFIFCISEIIEHLGK